MPHFIIIHENGNIEDYSLDVANSPEITSYPQFPKSGTDSCAIFYPESMKIIMRHKQSKELMEWNFNDQTPEFTNSNTWDNNENNRQNGLCATSSSGKLFLYSEYLNSKIMNCACFNYLFE